MLSLAYGLARGGPTGIIPAVALVALYGTMSAYSMTVLARLSHEVGAESIADIWGRLKSEKTKWLIDASVLVLCYCCCVFYATFFYGFFETLLNGTGAKVRVPLLDLSILSILPMCLGDRLSDLQLASLLGAMSIFNCVFFHVKRWLINAHVPGSYFLKYVDPELRPHFTPSGLSWLRISSGTLVLAKMLSVAFLAHYNSVPYFRELNSSVADYRKGIGHGFGIVALVFLTVMFVGYQLFGSAAPPSILNNFPITPDGFADGARLCALAATVLAFPLMFSGVKSSILALLDSVSPPQLPRADDVKRSSKRVYRKEIVVSTTVFLSIILIAMHNSDTDATSLVDITVSVFGCLLAYILPNYLNILHNHRRNKVGLPTNGREVALNYVMMVVGVLSSMMGVWVAIADRALKRHS